VADVRPFRGICLKLQSLKFYWLIKMDLRGVMTLAMFVAIRRACEELGLSRIG
jgi:hypothetical protein